MKTSSYSKNKVKKKADKLFDKNLLNRLAKTSGFCKRKVQKITPLAFVLGFIQSITKGGNTYSSWAIKIGEITGKALSKQALFERMAEPAVLFSQALLQQALSVRLHALRPESSLLQHFNRILLHDSTTLALPQVLAGLFPGTVRKGVKKATARLQCLLNIKNMQWQELSLKAFCDNDQSASGDALPHLRKGDLLIRDLGYFVLEVFEQVVARKAFFVSRLRYGIVLMDEKGKDLDWKKLVRKRTLTDKWVWIGREQKLKVRLIMVPLPAAQVEERVRKARKDRDRRLNHSADYYEWLGYNVFITNIEQDVLSGHQVVELYGVRWYIEMMFKAWKSGLHMQGMLHEGCSNEYRARTSIYLLLLWFCVTLQKIYCPYARTIRRSEGRELSLLKVFKFVGSMLDKVLSISKEQLKKQLLKHCCYEKRKDRINMIERILNLSLVAA